MSGRYEAGGIEDVVVVPPAPGDVVIDIAERALARSYTVPGGFSIEDLRAHAARATDDHEPFPLVRVRRRA